MKTIPIRHIKDTLKEPSLLGDFTIRSLSELLDGKNMVHELHRHDFYFILFLKKGNGNHEIDFINYDVSDYSVFIIRPGQVHHLELRSDSIGFMIQFSPEFYYPIEKEPNILLQKASAKNYYKIDDISYTRLNVLLVSILNEYQNKPEEYEEVIKSNLRILFIELIRLRRVNSNEKPDNNDLYVQERLEEFLQLLEANISKEKQVSQYASMLSLSNYQLNAITKQTLGKTASELINEQIILESKRYLLATSNQVNQIAYHLGYEDVSYFIRFFKKHTSYSPESFRKKLK
ncbi:AraC family transcriptional regulator [Cellulophaga sp. HaHa_2_1]|jgi:AraC-like DNA-binding protein|uniref:AraC family transcriptional regulator n=1 Tax=Cellulophaga sp. HaHa_2_1 TaxID=2749994 RepID=UPI001C5017FD|nr:AraC family transcriptional regulator [Cellulophaga sp. HaHa_2_1]QXP53792.1 helix-turn-helix domain-containing protein [Cellulophaga sp. HaHa_2_1]